MADYIDRKALKATIMARAEQVQNTDPILRAAQTAERLQILAIIDNEPAADVANKLQGRREPIPKMSFEEKANLYTKTTKRLQRCGICDPTNAIIYLADECEIYREKIAALELDMAKLHREKEGNT